MQPLSIFHRSLEVKRQLGLANKKRLPKRESYLSGCRDLRSPLQVGNAGPHGPEPVSEILNCSPHDYEKHQTMWTTMSLKPCSNGSKIEFRVWQSCHFLSFGMRSYILLDVKKRCQASPSTPNSILIEPPTARYNLNQRIAAISLVCFLVRPLNPIFDS